MNLGMLKVLAAIGHLVTTSTYDTPKNLDAKQIYCVATAVYSEAKGEPIMGKIAVAYAIKHRTESKDFPKTACEVIYQTQPSVQFPDIREVKPDYNGKVWEQSVEAALMAWTGFVDDPIKKNRFFCNPDKVGMPTWGRIKNKVTIASHLFYDVHKGT